jgi:hypothetical protein
MPPPDFDGQDLHRSPIPVTRRTAAPLSSAPQRPGPRLQGVEKLERNRAGEGSLPRGGNLDPRALITENSSSNTCNRPSFKA